MAKLSMIIQPGQRFGMLEAIKDVGHGKWLCKCDCGNVGEFLGKELRGGRRHSCGCLKHKQRKESLVGKQFGEWEVLEYVGKNKWHCRCSCGTERNINRCDLESGKTKSCGHSTTGFKDLTGKMFNEWEVLSYLGESKYECRCSCGKLGIVTRRDLLTGQSRSCGHSTNALVDLTGKHFGEWTVLKHTGYGHWLCQCSCGTIKEIRHTELLNGDSKSCGCKRSELSMKTKLEHYGTQAISLEENNIANWVKELFPKIKVLRWYRDKDNNDLELDIYMPEIGFAIEYNGSYWHSTRNKHPLYHQNKTLQFFKKHIDIFNIFDYEWKNTKMNKKIRQVLYREISYRIHNKLGIRQDNILDYDINRCRVVKENKIKAMQFLDENCLYKSGNFDIAYALYYDEKIMCIITFNKISKNGYIIHRISWEKLIRLYTVQMK